MSVLDLKDFIPTFPMAVSLAAMGIQLVFGVLNLRRAKAETLRQIAETKKQEMLLAMQTEEGYKEEVRQWGLQALDAMALAQQLCTINPRGLKNSDFEIERASTVATLRGLLNRAKWLFPDLAVPSREDESFTYMPERKHSALESMVRILKFRTEFVEEMRCAVDPHVRGEDIQAVVAELHRSNSSSVPKPIAREEE